jgi:hypothetical protein
MYVEEHPNHKLKYFWCSFVKAGTKNGKGTLAAIRTSTRL